MAVVHALLMSGQLAPVCTLGCVMPFCCMSLIVLEEGADVAFGA